jgi:hypothetical protein
MSEEWFYEPERYVQDHPELVEMIKELEEANVSLLTHNHQLVQANSSMMRLIQANDQKQALMEASPEFAEAMNKISEA